MYVNDLLGALGIADLKWNYAMTVSVPGHLESREHTKRILLVELLTCLAAMLSLGSF